MAVSPILIRTPDELTATWLQAALGSAPVASFTVEPVGTGQMSELHRVTLSYEDPAPGDPATVVLKTAATDPTSRGTGVGMGAYLREVRFYQELAPRIGGPLAGVHHAVYDEAEGWFSLLLEDAAPAVQGDQLAGCSPEEAARALEALAAVHAPVLGNSELGLTPWLNVPTPLTQALVTAVLPGFTERYGDRVETDHLGVVEAFAASCDAWAAAARPPLGLVHGDYRLDNLLFGEPGSPRPVTVADWQTVSWGPVMLDASYFLGSSLTVDDRRAHEEARLRGYHERLLAGGVAGFPWEDCWNGYRQQSFHNVLMAVVASMVVQQTPRGDDMFMTVLGRAAQQVLDLDALELLPAPGSGGPAPLQPDPADEGTHPAGAEELWNESWYFDTGAPDGSLGAYVRLGLYPNLGVAWYTTFVSTPDRVVAVVDLEAPLPRADDAQLRTAPGGGTASHTCDAPLEAWTLRLRGTGLSYPSAAAALRSEGGEPVDVALELTWSTEGTPYAYRQATRYEIPCRVSGTIEVDGEVIDAAGWTGQRDHSWGTRDWWALGWVWSAGELEDGTRLHAVELRLPDGPKLGVGYDQRDGEVHELTAVTATEEVGEDGLPTSATLTLTPGDLEVTLTPLAWGPLHLTAPDGRETSFPRALCRWALADGRTGLGWAEWNLG